MEWIEADPLPEECQNCQEEDCYNCDHALKRWYLSREDENNIKKEFRKSHGANVKNRIILYNVKNCNLDNNMIVS